VPFAAAGVDDTFDVVTTLPGTGRLLMQHAKYDLPVLWGRGPLPRAVPFWFRFGAPIQPGGCAEALHAQAWTTTQRLLDDLHGEWKARDAAPALPGGAA
jgi:hypothetical protein